MFGYSPFFLNYWVTMIFCPFILFDYYFFQDLLYDVEFYLMMTFLVRLPFLIPCVIIVIFAAACMTWELAESGKHFITTIINGSDLVPTFSTSSIDDLRSEVL